MFICFDKKYIFVAIARTGSTSMYNRVEELGGNYISGRSFLKQPEYFHRPLKYILKDYEEKGVANYFKFCFVRDPYTRFLSAWREFRREEHLFWSEEILNYTKFKDFCLDFKNTGFYTNKEVHFLPQTEVISIDGKICVDKIFRFENMSEAISELQGILKLDRPLSNHHNRKTTPVPGEDYDEHARNAIYDIYESDFVNFNYKK